MNPALDTIAISAIVVTLTQLMKWAFLPDRHGPIFVLIFSVAGVAAFGYSNGVPFAGPQIWHYITSTVNVMLAAAGIFGFSRATQASDVTKFGGRDPGRG